jgi:hypothetical protein
MLKELHKNVAINVTTEDLDKEQKDAKVKINLPDEIGLGALLGMLIAVLKHQGASKWKIIIEILRTWRWL